MQKKLVLFLICFIGVFSYSAKKAVAYANKYCDKRNKEYHDYSNEGGDCANFVSQCLIAGGLSLSECVHDKHGSVINVGKLESCLKNKGWHHKESSSIPDGFKAGGVITINNGGHAMIAVTKTTFAAHTNDRCGAKIPNSKNKYFWK
jgi:hypothetical protein